VKIKKARTQKMIKVKYILDDGSKDWLYEMKDLRSAVECIKEDMETYPRIAMVIVFDEENRKIFEVK
jgi:hypothetical protein